MAMILQMIYGAGIATFLIAAVGLCVWVYDMQKQKKYNRLITIKNITAGKAYVEYYWGRLMWHDKLGHVYFIPQLLKDKRAYIPYGGSSEEYPTNKGNKYFVSKYFYNGTYASEEFVGTETIKKDAIVFDHETKTYVKKTIDVSQFIIKPTKASTRQFNLMLDTQIKDEFGEKPTFWDKWGSALLGFGALFLFVIGGIIVFILLLQYGMDITQGTKDVPIWAEQLLNTATAGQTP